MFRNFHVFMSPEEGGDAGPGSGGIAGAATAAAEASGGEGGDSGEGSEGESGGDPASGDDAAGDGGSEGSGEDGSTDDSGESSEGSEEGKGSEDKGTGDDDAESDPLRGAPEGDYAEFTVPEGFMIEAEDSSELQAFGKEFDLSHEGVQKLVDLASKREQRKLQQLYDSKVETYNNHVEQSKADAEFGGKDYEKNITAMGRLIQRAYGKDAEGLAQFVSAIDEVNVNPEFNRGFFRLMALVPTEQDDFVDDNTPPRKQETYNSDAQRGRKLYPSMRKNQ